MPTAYHVRHVEEVLCLFAAPAWGPIGELSLAAAEDAIPRKPVSSGPVTRPDNMDLVALAILLDLLINEPAALLLYRHLRKQVLDPRLIPFVLSGEEVALWIINLLHITGHAVMSENGRRIILP